MKNKHRQTDRQLDRDRQIDRARQMCDEQRSKEKDMPTSEKGIDSDEEVNLTAN